MDPCSVCGGTDVNLVDGFYYCVECGTQDVNARETVVEQTVMGDGTFAHTTSRKFTTVVKDGIEMSSEWHKWHTFNFILAGLTDELIAAGAKPSVKMKVLWIWSRYIKHFQIKDNTELYDKLDIEDNNNHNDDTNEQQESNESDDEDSENDDSIEICGKKSKKTKSDNVMCDIKNITKGTLLAILYVALNLDRSDIQLSHLFRFVREGRLSLYDCMKYVPKELKMNVVKNWKSFTLSQKEHNPLSIRKWGMTCFKVLKLGVPLVPDLTKLVRNFVQELCLPEDLKNLVFALMHYMPVDFMDIDAKVQPSLVRIPDYEGICMAYVCIALKMCFGLDDDYELRISAEVDKINEEENFLKSYKLGMFSECCDRLFSFKEWCQHLQFRKYILCKNYLPMSQQFNEQTDDFVFMEHLKERSKRAIKLSDDVTMDILNKIKSDEESRVLAKTDFPVTLTPMSTYIDVIAQRVRDPELRLLLCEDFTQYSLKYAIKDMRLPGYSYDNDNSIVGVSKSGKNFNDYVVGTLAVQEVDTTMIYVRDCQNKNWLKTDRPKMHHVTKMNPNENSSDKESDHGYDSNIENSNLESDITHVTLTMNDECVNKNKTLEIFNHLDDKKSIFDGIFPNIQPETCNIGHTSIKQEQTGDMTFEFNTQNNTAIESSKVNSLDNLEECEERNLSIQFDANTFDRDRIIKELIEFTCKQYKIPLPKENIVKKQRKRKVSLVGDKTEASEPRKKRTVKGSKPGDAKREVDNLVTAYYFNLRNDCLIKISEQVKSIIEARSNPILQESNVFDSQKEVNDSTIKDIQNDDVTSNVLNFVDSEKSCTQIEANDSVVENSVSVINSEEQNEENIENNLFDEIFPKSDPKFDENDHDISQLYVKLEDNVNTHNVLIAEIDNDPEVDKLIKKNIEQSGRNALEKVESNAAINDTDNISDSEDDILLSTLKETKWFEREKIDRKKEKLDPLISDFSRVKVFNYWVRHYKSKYAVKTRDIGKKFDLELRQNLPISFAFVIRECAAVLGYSMFSLYKNMQNIEEILITNKN